MPWTVTSGSARCWGWTKGRRSFMSPSHPRRERGSTRYYVKHDLQGRSFAVLVPGTIWPTKHWHIEGFAAVARHLRNTGRAVVLAGSASERQRCRAVADLAPGSVDLSGQTKLSELAALIRRADLCVTNDSGSMHLTVALGRPVVSVFGPTDPLWIGPYGRPDAVVRADRPAPRATSASYRLPAQSRLYERGHFRHGDRPHRAHSCAERREAV